MSKLGFTDEEEKIISACRNYTLLNVVGYYASMLLPLLAFGVYGFIKADVIAISIGFAGLFSFTLWFLFKSYSKSKIYQSLFLKIAEFEKKIS